jgi:nucleotide-binding universal stress UspA family protein
MRSTVLVPTDFSENAFLAGKFALKLAEKIQADVCFLHSFVSLQSAFQGEQENVLNREEAEGKANEEMSNFLAKLAEDESVKYNFVVTDKNLLDAIHEISLTVDLKLIVMGTTGASGLKYHVIGSNTYAVAKNLNVSPLVIVPPGISNFTLEKIVFFTDFNPGDLNTVTSLKNVFPTFVSTIKLIHFGKQEERMSEEVQLARWALELKSKSGLQNISWSWIAGEEGIESVQNLDEVFDLILVTQKDRNFFESLVSKNMAKELIHQSMTPVFLSNVLS